MYRLVLLILYAIQRVWSKFQEWCAKRIPFYTSSCINSRGTNPFLQATAPDWQKLLSWKLKTSVFLSANDVLSYLTLNLPLQSLLTVSPVPTFLTFFHSRSLAAKDCLYRLLSSLGNIDIAFLASSLSFLIMTWQWTQGAMTEVHSLLRIYCSHCIYCPIPSPFYLYTAELLRSRRLE